MVKGSATKTDGCQKIDDLQTSKIPTEFLGGRKTVSY
jgi:hypothetical protein